MFNDLLLVTEPKRSNGYQVVILLDLSHVTAVRALEDSDVVQNCFLLDTPRRALMLLADSAAQRDEWVARLSQQVLTLSEQASSRDESAKLQHKQ